MAGISVRRFGGAALLVVLLLGCGRSTKNGTNADAASGAGGSGNAGTGPGGSGSSPATCCQTGQCPCEMPTVNSDGVVPMHRLRSAEYANTITDLLGISATSPERDDTKPADASIANAQLWIDAVSDVVAKLPMQGKLPSPFECAGADVDRACALSSIDAFGLKAFRRPILDVERQAFIKLYDTVTETDGSRVAFGEVLRAMLLSPAFLFHVELSDHPDATTPEPLDSYALAARLSFALWRTTPDSALLDAAATDLTPDAALTAAFDRLARDARAQELADGLSDVWLGVDRLTEHVVNSQRFPAWDAAKSQAVIDESHQFLRSFWVEPQPLLELLTRPQGDRSGLLELRSILTLTSTDLRTSATLRGKYVLDRLLCTPVPSPPQGSNMDLGPDYPAGVSERQALENAVKGPACEACHNLIDPIGLALGNFDGIGTYRSVDGTGMPVDVTVQLSSDLSPDGKPVTGSQGLAAAVAASPRFRSCASQQLASYMIQRDVTEPTDPGLVLPLIDLVDSKAALPELARRVVLSDQFRYRRVPAAAP